MFPEDLFEYVREQLAEEISASPPAVMPSPMPCDRWIARSALQKAIRRGEADVALAALAALFDQHPDGVWRNVVIIAIEDVGVADMDLVARVICAARDKRWRARLGGDWTVAAHLVRRMAESGHCQAACDLLLKSLNDPGLDATRLAALEADCSLLADQLADTAMPLEHRAVAALALGGGLSEDQTHRQPGAVFHVLSQLGHSSHVTATCDAARKASRNEMALLLPLVWERWMVEGEKAEYRDDDLTPLACIRGVPACALDQFTRVGLLAIRALVARDPALRSLLQAADVPSGDWAKVVGDVIFLVEGGLVTRHAHWSDGDSLRLPFRGLAGAYRLGSHLPVITAHIRCQGPLIANLRSWAFSPHATR